MRMVFLGEGLYRNGNGPGKCWEKSLMVACPVLTQHLHSFGLFSGMCHRPHQLLSWHGRLPYHLSFLGVLHNAGPVEPGGSCIPPFHHRHKKHSGVNVALPWHCSPCCLHIFTKALLKSRIQLTLKTTEIVCYQLPL